MQNKLDFEVKNKNALMENILLIFNTARLIYYYKCRFVAKAAFNVVYLNEKKNIHFKNESYCKYG